MNETEAVEEALRVFPKLYYFVPRLNPFTVDVPAAKRAVLANKLNKTESQVATIKIEEPLDTILWLIDTLCPEHSNQHCLQIDVEHLVKRWTSVTFSREIAKLYAAELIDGHVQVIGHGKTLPDRRYRELQLTDKGKRILGQIKNDRRRILSLMFKGLDPDRMEAVASGLNAVAAATWPKMKVKTTVKKNRSRKRSIRKRK